MEVSIKEIVISIQQILKAEVFSEVLTAYARNVLKKIENTQLPWKSDYK